MKALELKNVTKNFKDGDNIIEALKPTNFFVEKGEFIAITGPSGSGKSTLLTIAGGLQNPTEGQVLINGIDFTNKNERERSKLRFKEIGFILQASNLVPFLTVKKQLKLVDKINKKSNTLEAKDLIKNLNVEKLVNKYPEELSGGEKQRVAIIRALYNNPDLILADEPTASLDTERAFAVVDILSREAKERNKAIIMVTHDLRMIDKCDKVYVIKDGILSEKI